jgi:hypothetical protein
MHIEPPTSGTTRLVAVRRASIVAVAALSCAALMSACGSSSSKSTTAKTNLNTAQVALSIEQTVLTKRHLRAKVSCPAAVPQEKGRTFECTATSRSAKPPFTVISTPFVVTIKTDKGYVEYVGK